jgi:hypothetical protein
MPTTITIGIAVQISSSRAVELGTFQLARASAPAIAKDEPQQRPLDDDEDDPRQQTDQLVVVVDATRVRRVRRLRCETAVAGVRDGCDRQRGAEHEDEDSELPPH